MPALRPIASEPIAIRRAVDEGWAGFRRHAVVLVGFTVLLGGLNLLSWLAYRGSGGLLERGLPQASTAALLLAGASLVAYLVSGFWLLTGLIRGAELALDGQPPSLRRVLRIDANSMARLAWSQLLLLLLLALTLQTGEASSWVMALLLPRLTLLPTLAAWGVVIYVLVDQVLLLPITVLANQAGLRAFRSGRRATDPHWLQAAGLLLVVGLILLAGFLLLVGLAVALPFACCTLVAAYRQVFVLPAPTAPGAPRPESCAAQETGWPDSNG